MRPDMLGIYQYCNDAQNCITVNVCAGCGDYWLDGVSLITRSVQSCFCPADDWDTLTYCSAIKYCESKKVMGRYTMVDYLTATTKL